MMRIIPLILLLGAAMVCSGAGPAWAAEDLSPRCQFAEKDAGARLLQESDRFLESLSEFELQSRLQTKDDVSLKARQRFVAAQVLYWTDSEKAMLRRLLDQVSAKFPVDLLPETVIFIKTTGKEEGGAAYCRRHAVALPLRLLQMPDDRLQRLLVHELFHVISSHQPALRKQLYAIIGFTTCAALELPESLRDRKITNPDAPLIDCFIRLQAGDREFAAAPILFATPATYDVSAGGTFFRYLTFRVMELEETAGKRQVRLENGEPVLHDPRQLASYAEQIGRNTNYIIHPDEILADNFVSLVLADGNLKTPRIIEAMRQVLDQHSTP